MHNFPAHRKLVAAEFPMPSLTCSELRKFSDLHRGGSCGGPGVVRCQNLVPAFPDLRLHWGYLEALYPRRQTGGWHGKWSWGDEQLSTTSPDPTCPVLWEGWERARRTGRWDQHSRVASWSDWPREMGDQMYLLPGPWGGRGVEAHTQNCKW